MDSFFIEILKQGGLATIAVVAIIFAVRKDRQCTQLYDRLERKSEKYLEQNLKLERELNETISALAEALEMEVDK